MFIYTYIYRHIHTHLARLALHPQHWNHTYVPLCLTFFTWALRLNSDPHACRASSLLSDPSPSLPSFDKLSSPSKKPML